jgi:glutamate:GABA antiporter
VEESTPPPLRRALGLGDMVLFFVTTGTNLQWVATAAVAGPSALVVWVIGALAMFVPLGYSVIALSARYPQEGGLYVWTRRSFGDFAGFLTGWTYWTSNLPYFPGVLYFAAGNGLYVFGDRFHHLSASPAYFIVASLLGLALATLLNLLGLEVGKWLTNVGAICRWVATLILIAIGAIAVVRFGSATSFAPATLVPSLGLKDVLFFSTIAFALTGFESASFMGEEIRDPLKSLPRAMFAAAPLIATIYILGTLSVLVALPADEISSLAGIMQAIESASRRVGFPGFAPVAAALIAISSLGSVGAWLAAVARIPFVAGLDHFLPDGFGRMHPRWGSPYVALLTQSGITVIFVFLGQAGTSVRGAYEALVSMTIVVTMLPFLFVFASAIKLQLGPGPRPALPGGRPAALACGIVGFVTTAVSLVLSAFPSEAEPNKPLAVAKVLGMTALILATGVVLYVLGRRRARRTPHAAAAAH